jgi:cytochrome c
MSYAKAMRHWRNPKKHKLTATRLRGNGLVFGTLTTCPRCNVDRSERIAGNALRCLNCHVEWNLPVRNQ